MKRLLTVFAAVSLSAGCATEPKQGYMSSDRDVFGDASKLEYTQKSRTVTLAVERLFTDPTFTDRYAEAL